MSKEPQLVVQKSGINGNGCFAAEPLPARRKIGELIGERISNREARRRVARGGKVRICELAERWSSTGTCCFSRCATSAAGEELKLDYTPVTASRTALYMWRAELPRRDGLVANRTAAGGRMWIDNAASDR